MEEDIGLKIHTCLCRPQNAPSYRCFYLNICRALILAFQDMYCTCEWGAHNVRHSANPQKV